MPDTPEGRVFLAVLQNSMDHLGQELAEVKSAQKETNLLLRSLNGSVRQHETRIVVLEHFCDEQVKPMMEIANENKLRLAEIMAKWGSIGIGGGGVVGMIVYLIGKSQAWW